MKHQLQCNHIKLIFVIELTLISNAVNSIDREHSV